MGVDDPIADPAPSRAVASKIAGGDYHDLAGLKHEVFDEEVFDEEVFDEEVFDEEVFDEIKRGKVLLEFTAVLVATARAPAKISGS